MDDSKYNEQFKALTDGLEFEKIYDAIAARSELVRRVVVHCAVIHKQARQSGLPRGVSERMAMEYFNYEIQPAGLYVIEEGDEL